MVELRTIVGLGLIVLSSTIIPETLGAADRAPGMGHGFLIDKHISAGLNCTSCHGQGKPTNAVATTVCLTCHKPDASGQFVGNGPKQYGFDGGVTMTFNVHQPHFLEIPCTACHKVHAASVNFCNQCHLMKGMAVP